VTSPHAGEESATPLALSLSIADDTRRFLQRTGDTLSKPLSALGRILGEALDGLDGAPGTVPQTPPPGGVAQGGGEGGQQRQQQIPVLPQVSTPYKPRVRQFAVGPQTPSTPGSRPGTPSPDGTPSRIVPGANRELGFGLGRTSLPQHLLQGQGQEGGEGGGVSRTPTPALDISELQEEIDRAHERASSASLGTLTQIFPTVDREVIEWVLEAEEGDLGRSIEKLLEMTAGE